MNASSATSNPLYVFAGGGTGGHLYPSIAVAREIREQIRDARFVFFGTTRPIDRQVTSTIECEFVPQKLSSLSLAPWVLARAGLEFFRAERHCRRRFSECRPAVVVGTGGLAAMPAVRAAVRLGIPTALLNPDAIPGKANRRLAPKTSVVFAQFDRSLDEFPGSVEVLVTGCPVRPEFYSETRDAGFSRFGLDPKRKVLLVTGASLGARTVNQAVVANAAFLHESSDWQILHLTGRNDFEMVQSGYRQAGAQRVQVLDYTEDMALAMSAADLIVSRAGASTLAEIMAAGRPSILMPYPFHRDQHQVVNARCLADCGAAELVMDAVNVDTNAATLRAALRQCMQDDERRRHMAASVQRLGVSRRDAARKIAARLISLSDASVAPCDDRRGIESLKASFQPAR